MSPYRINEYKKLQKEWDAYQLELAKAKLFKRGKPS
jgi:hypothetical protein